MERLAHQLGAFTRKTAPATTSGAQSSKPPSTITVGTLLNDADRRKAAAATQAGARVPDDIADPNDNTDETDRTGSADIKAPGSSIRRPWEFGTALRRNMSRQRRARHRKR